MTQLALSVGFW